MCHGKGSLRSGADGAVGRLRERDCGASAQALLVGEIPPSRGRAGTASGSPRPSARGGIYDCFSARRGGRDPRRWHLVRDGDNGRARETGRATRAEAALLRRSEGTSASGASAQWARRPARAASRCACRRDRLEDTQRTRRQPGHLLRRLQSVHGKPTWPTCRRAKERGGRRSRLRRPRLCHAVTPPGVREDAHVVAVASFHTHRYDGEWREDVREGQGGQRRSPSGHDGERHQARR